MKRIFDKDKMSKLGKVKLVFCLFGHLISSYFNGLHGRLRGLKRDKLK